MLRNYSISVQLQYSLGIEQQQALWHIGCDLVFSMME